MGPETHHLTVSVNNNDNNDNNNNNNYAPVCKEACKLTNLSMLSRDKRTDDSKGELINSLSGSYCLSMRRRTVQKRSERGERPKVRERDRVCPKESDIARERPKMRARETECDRERATVRE